VRQRIGHVWACRSRWSRREEAGQPVEESPREQERRYWEHVEMVGVRFGSSRTAQIEDVLPM